MCVEEKRGKRCVWMQDEYRTDWDNVQCLSVGGHPGSHCCSYGAFVLGTRQGPPPEIRQVKMAALQSQVKENQTQETKLLLPRLETPHSTTYNVKKRTSFSVRTKLGWEFHQCF